MLLTLLIIIGVVLLYNKAKEKKYFERRVQERVYSQQIFKNDVSSKRIVENIKRAKEYRENYPNYPFGIIRLYNDTPDLPNSTYYLCLQMENHDAFVQETIKPYLIAPKDSAWIIDMLKKCGITETDSPEECIRKLKASNIDFGTAGACGVVDRKYEDEVLPIYGGIYPDKGGHVIRNVYVKPEEINSHTWLMLLKEQIEVEISGVTVKTIDSATLHINV